jgi:putative FmdB family regulatory protein
MPLYDLSCKQCGHLWEIMKPIQEATPACPKCGGKAKILPALVNTTGQKKSASLDHAKKLGFKVLRRKSKGVYREER